MKLRNLYIYITSFFMSALLFTGCDDEPLVDVPELGEGSATLSATVSFFPHAEVLGSRSTKGDAIKNIESLSVIVYDQYKALYKIYNSNNNVKDFTYTQVTHSDNPTMSPDDTSHKAQWSGEESARATFTLEGDKLPFGKYYIYCVANMGSITEEQAEDLEKLKKMELTWNKTNIAANNQMFGYFTLSSKSSEDTPLAGFDADPIFVSKATLDGNGKVPVHAWIKRAASKVTVAYDPSGLKENVFIYIRKVTIKDIPVKCLLGADNTPVLGEDKDKSKVLNEDGESIYYNTGGEVDKDAGKDYKTWLKLSSGVDPQGSKHIPTDNALFFYENMQGDYQDQSKYYKVPQADTVNACIGGDYKNPSNYDTKDQVPMGSYIEVEGFYVSRNTDNIGSGPIKYRFMLGKNTTYNFNAQRNHHYKLTLKFNGWANQPEWHIDYQEENPGMYIPDRVYMPYLYNQKSSLPIKLNGNCTKLEFRIVQNNWGPIYENGVVPDKRIGEGGSAWNLGNDDYYHDFIWNLEAYKKFPPGEGTMDLPISGEGEETVPNYKPQYSYLGFLSLTKPDEEGQFPADILNDVGYAEKDDGFKKLELYYNGEDYEGNESVWVPHNQNTIPQGTRTIKEIPSIPGTYKGEDGKVINAYTVSKQGEGDTRTVSIPLFTRPKSMISISGFTGNNPYEYFYRRAIVLVKGTFKMESGEEIVKWQKVEVMQVPRITNPKAIWRSSGKTDGFDVLLCTRKDPKSNSDYEGFKSDGSWEATIDAVGNSSNFYLTGEGVNSEGTKVTGKTGTEIKFKVNFGGIDGCGIVTVLYNGGSCIHKIFLRQGYGPIAVTSDDKPKWSSFNVYKFDDDVELGTDGSTYKSDEDRIGVTLVESPLSIGSLFKKGNYTQGIKASNNNTYKAQVELKGGELELTDGSSKTWANIKAHNQTSSSEDTKNWEWARSTNGTRNYRVPTYEEYNKLSTQCDFGYGVLYGDGATQTQIECGNAEGYEDLDGRTSTSEKGVRGVVVYNKNTGNQIFFSMGKYGQGRRTQAFYPEEKTDKGTNKWTSTSLVAGGKLRYGDVSYLLDPTSTDNANLYRPIPYNLAHLPGSIYWINQVKAKGHIESSGAYDCGAWDINYFSFDFGPYTNNCRMDALPIRLVLDK